MSENEQLQAKKDLLWEIHVKKGQVACLVRTIAGQVNCMERIVKAWKDDSLTAGVTNGKAVLRIGREDTALDSEALYAAVKDRADSIACLDSLRDSFNKISGVLTK